MMGGGASDEFMLVNEAGEDTLVLYDACGYAVDAEGAIAERTGVPKEQKRDVEEVATPGMNTIEEVAGSGCQAIADFEGYLLYGWRPTGSYRYRRRPGGPRDKGSQPALGP